jgi:hypothetical protein
MEDVKAINFQPSTDMQSDINSSAMTSDDLHAMFWNQPPAAECTCPGDCFAIAAEQGAGGPADYGCRLQFHRDSSQFVAFKQMKLRATDPTAPGLNKVSSAGASPFDSALPTIARIPGYTSVSTCTVSRRL